MSKSMGIVPALGFKFVKDQTSVLHKPKVWYTYQQMEELFCFFGWWSQSCWFYSGCVSLWNLQGTLLLVRALPVVFVRVFVGVTRVVGLSKWGRCGLKILIVWQCLQSLIDGHIVDSLWWLPVVKGSDLRFGVRLQSVLIAWHPGRQHDTCAGWWV